MSTIGQPIVESNLTLLEMKAEIDRLKQENQELRERNDLLLHNIIENQNDKKEFLNKDTFLDDLNLTDKFLNNIETLGYDPDEMEKAYIEAEKNYRF